MERWAAVFVSAVRRTYCKDVKRGRRRGCGHILKGPKALITHATPLLGARHRDHGDGMGKLILKVFGHF